MRACRRSGCIRPEVGKEWTRLKDVTSNAKVRMHPQAARAGAAANGVFLKATLLKLAGEM